MSEAWATPSSLCVVREVRVVAASSPLFSLILPSLLPPTVCDTAISICMVSIWPALLPRTPVCYAARSLATEKKQIRNQRFIGFYKRLTHLEREHKFF